MSHLVDVILTMNVDFGPDRRRARECGVMNFDAAYSPTEPLVPPQRRTRMSCSSCRPSRVATTTIALGPALVIETMASSDALRPLQGV